MTNLDTLDKDLETANGEFERLKEESKLKKNELANAAAALKVATQSNEQYEVKAGNLNKILETSAVVDPLVVSVDRLKGEVINMCAKAKATMLKVHEAVNTSSDLGRLIEDIKKNPDGPPREVSPDLENDSKATNASIAKAYDDAVEAYKNSVTAVKSVISLHESLLVIREILERITNNTTIVDISSKFNASLSRSKEELTQAIANEKAADDASKAVEVLYAASEKKLKSLNDSKALLVSLNV